MHLHFDYSHNIGRQDNYALSNQPVS